MSQSSPRSRSVHRTAKIVLGTAVVAGIALAATLPAVATTTGTPVVSVTPVGSSTVASNGAPQLGDLAVPAQPAGCSAGQIRERNRQLELLAAEQAAEVRVIETITDGSAPAKLQAIRDRADTILGRIASLDAQCGGEAAPAQPPAAQPPAGEEPAGEEPVAEEPAGAEPPAELPPAEQPAGVDRVLVALEITCAEVDFGDADAAAVARATGELANNEAQLNARLDSDFPRFSNRVAREANPEAARAEFTRLAEGLAGTLEARRGAILDRAGDGLADEFADTCEVVEVA